MHEVVEIIGAEEKLFISNDGEKYLYTPTHVIIYGPGAATMGKIVSSKGVHPTYGMGPNKDVFCSGGEPFGSPDSLMVHTGKGRFDFISGRWM